ncbi:MAG TPA: hypothetical protein VFV19_05090 [Candidatus Polarisedimenticolaceae bacterium]|nr:hypothetical protein [Candidatus Polarisedimenticolaceae bacterium]
MIDSIIAGRVAVALTHAGTLLRFSLPEVALTGEYSGRSPIACVGALNGVIIAAAEDGTVYTVDIARMSLNAIAHVTGRPVWVSPMPSEWVEPRVLIVTASSERKRWTAQEGGGEYDADVLTVFNLPGKAAFRLEGEFNGDRTFLLSEHRLWIGFDAGEFGGRCGYLDVDLGRQKWFDSGDVYGFASVDGGVLAFGGGMHLGLSGAFIGSVRDDAFSILYEQTNYRPDDPKFDPPKDRPLLPISAVIPDATPGHLLVFSYDRVFLVDQEFKTWNDAARLHLRYGTGRANAVGFYPSIVKAHPLDRPFRFLLATKLDGYLLLDFGKVLSKAVPFQPTGTGFDTLVTFGSSIAFVNSTEARSPQVFDGKIWKELPVFPSDTGEDCWSEGFVTPGANDSLLMTATSCESPGSRVLSRWRHDRVEVLHRWTSDDWWRDILGTADGAIWHFGGGRITRLVGGDWVDADAGSEASDLPDSTVDLQKVVSEIGPPWFILNRRLSPLAIDHRLVMFDYDREFHSARLRDVKLDGDDSLEVYDAIALAPSRLLVATSAGLKVFDTRSNTLLSCEFPVPPQEVRRLARDRRGRIWMGGAGLWILDGHDLIDGGSRLSSTGNDVEALAKNPMSDGVIVLLKRGMVLFLDTPR